MDKRLLGNGLEVSAVGLGCMGFSHAYGAPMDRKKAVSMIRSAYEMGYTFFDIAEVYGTPEDPHQNEELVGEALKWVRSQVKIVSKFGIRFAVENRYSMMARCCEELFPVLEELGVGLVAFSSMANGFLTGKCRGGKYKAVSRGSMGIG